MKSFTLRAIALFGFALVTLSPPLYATPLSVEVTSGTTVSSDYYPSDGFDPAVLCQNIALIAPPTLSLNGASSSISFTLSAPEGHMIQISPLAEGLRLAIVVNYIDGDATSLGTMGETRISFTNLIGTDPTTRFSNSLHIVNYGLLFQYSFDNVTSPFSFTSMTVTSGISGTGDNVILNSQTTLLQVQDNNYSGPDMEPYASLVSVPAVPEPAIWALQAFSLGVFLCVRNLKRRYRTA